MSVGTISLIQDLKNMKMSADKKFSKKYYKKTLNMLKEYENEIKLSNVPTAHLFIGNGGMLCGRTREQILSLFQKYGPVVNFIMIPKKSYSFLSYKNVESACEAIASLNSYIFEDADKGPVAPLYLFYIENEIKPAFLSYDDIYPIENSRELIDGLILEESFVDEKYEEELINYFKVLPNDTLETSNALKNRSVTHFGYEFLYGSNNIDRSNPLDKKIPEICKPLIDMMLEKKLIDFLPDQLTVNQYAPGQGIPPHIDTHSAFEDGIISLSLGSQVTMEFVGPNNGKTPIILPRRSLLVMKGESRYLWTHGITPRTYDIFYSQDKQLNLSERGTRLSLTFRKIRFDPCSCIYKEKCDSQNMAKTDNLFLPESVNEAVDLEGENVHKVYNEIACHFSDTRHSPWPRIKNFLCDLSSGYLVADVGCGNGKYLGINPNVVSMGCDRSSNLLDICGQRGFEVLLSDCLTLPYRTNAFDAAICIAVIHHLSTESRRIDAIKELVRVTCAGGLVLVSVWAMEQKEEDVKEGKVEYKPPLEEKNPIQVSAGRNVFQQQDLLIPWHLKNNQSVGNEEKVFHRFYHVFCQGELEYLCQKIENVEVQNVYFDSGNWCVILKKIV